jgi:hypothetical protein
MEPDKTPKQRKTRGGRDRPRAGIRRHERPYSTSLLDLERMVRSLLLKEKESLQCCQAIGREV